ncbi:MAG: hypothetical protein HGA94_05460, partial [Candidatus Aminicenantes bacterium]|nr:hypothetical protein [Candidatus Aminicenantes bacterium]
MGGFFGLVGKADIVEDLFFGTDYHSHLGTKRGGLAVGNGTGIVRYIHNIENAQFRSKFGEDVGKLRGTRGIGVISDYEDQPLLIRSHLGHFSIATVSVVKNIDQLVARAFKGKSLHFSEMRGGEVNPTELVAALINEKDTFEEGIRYAGEMIKGSCSILILTNEGVLAARDRYGRTPVVIGRKDGTSAASLETCAFPNLGFEIDRYLGPGEVVRLGPEGAETLAPPLDKLHLPGPDFLERVTMASDRSNQVLVNLAWLYRHGRLGGTGYLSLLPVDQGVEHSGGASFGPNPDCFDPEHIVKLAIEGGCNGVTSTYGVLGAVARKYAHQIPF